MKYLIFLILPAFLLLPACTTQYYLVRHAEKQDNSADSPLSDAGRARANDLCATLLNKGVSQIYASTFIRTQQTAQPLATARSLPLNLYSTDTTAAFISALERLGGRTVLVVGHSNTIPQIVQGLCGETVTIADNDFDNLFLVKITKGWGQPKKTLVKMTYGKVSP